MITVIISILLLFTHLPLIHSSLELTPYNLSTTSSCSSDKPTLLLTLDEALKQARAHKPTLLQQWHRIQEEKMKEKAAWSGYLPQLSLYSALSTPAKTASSLSAQMSGQQLIYKAGGPQAEALRIHKSVEIQEYEKIIQEQALSYDVEKAFMEAWQLQQQQKIMLQRELASKALYQIAEHQNNLHMLDKIEWLRAIESRSNSITSINTFRQSTIIAQKNLEFLLGYSVTIDLLSPHLMTQPITTLIFTPSIPEELESIENFYNKAFSKRIEIKQAQKQVEYEQESINIELRSTMPELSLFAHTGIGTCTGRSRSTHSIAGAQVRWPFFDGLASKFRTEQAASHKMQALLALEQIKQQVRIQVETAFLQATQALTLFKTKKAEYERAHNEFIRSQQEFQLGIVAKADFERAREFWYNVQFSLLTQEVETAKNILLLRYYCGELS